MAPKPFQQVWRGFKGGYDARGLDNASPNSLSIMDNTRIVTTFGQRSVERRRGAQRTTVAAWTAASNAKDARLYFWDAATPKLLLTPADGTLRYTTDLGNVNPQTWTQPAGVLTAGPTTMATFRNAGGTTLVYIADGTNLWKFDGTTLTKLVSVSAIDYLTVYNDRLYGAKGNTVYYSPIQDGDNLGISPNGGAVVLSTFRNENITGLVTLGTSLFIFTKNSIARFSGWSQDDFNLSAGTRGFSPSIGTGSCDQNGICVLGQYGYFINGDNEITYRFTESALEPISDPIQLAITGNATTCFIVPYPDRDEVLVFQRGRFRIWNAGIEQWSGQLTPPPGGVGGGLGAGTTVVPLNATYRIPYMFFMTGTFTGFVVRYDTPTDAAIALFKDDVLSDGTGGTAVVGLAYFRIFEPGGYFPELRIDHAYLVLNDGGNTTGYTVSISGDDSIAAGGSSYTLTTPGNSAIWRRYVAPVSGRGHSLVVNISDLTTAIPPGLTSLGVEGRVYATRPVVGISYT